MEHEYGKEVTGRCHTCNIRFIWKARRPLLRNALCPFCSRRLKPTTHCWKGQSIRKTPKDSFREKMKDYVRKDKEKTDG